MINTAAWQRLISVLTEGTDKDKIIWKNTMLNIHETFFHEERIVIDILQDDPPTFIIGHSALQLRGVGVEELAQHIDEQYKRLKKYRYSENARSTQAASEARAKTAQMENDLAFNAKISGLLVLDGAVCGKCHELLSERTQEIATLLGCRVIFCEKCNSHKSKLTEANMEKIRSILLGQERKK